MKPGLAAESLLGAALAGRASRTETPSRREADGGFASLLDGARERQGAGADAASNVYGGSAFDVPEAKRMAPKPAASSAEPRARGDSPRPRGDAASNGAGGEAARAAQAADRAANARAAEARASASNRARTAETLRDDAARPDREPATDAAASTAARTPGEAAAATGDRTPACEAPGVAGPGLPAPGTPEWLARWTALGGLAAAGGEPQGSAGLRAGAGAAAAQGGDAVQAAGVSGASGVNGANGAFGEIGANGANGANGASGISAAGSQAAGSEIGAVLETASVSDARLPVDAAGGLSSGLPAPLGSAAAAVGHAPEAAPPQPTASVPVPLEAPDFSQALGWQLATLARDGVHEAQLQLNPAEMGPVQVQIVLDGTQAQIDFSAAHARTREVLEAGWPALAAAMHSAGFTLGGGGVSEQRSGGRDGPGGHGGDARRSTDGEAGDGSGTVVTGLRSRAGSRGLLDLYA